MTTRRKEQLTFELERAFDAAAVAPCVLVALAVVLVFARAPANARARFWVPTTVVANHSCVWGASSQWSVRVRVAVVALETVVSALDRRASIASRRARAIHFDAVFARGLVRLRSDLCQLL